MVLLHAAFPLLLVLVLAVLGIAAVNGAIEASRAAAATAGDDARARSIPQQQRSQLEE